MVDTTGKVICINHQRIKKNPIITTHGIWINGKVYWLKDTSEKFLVNEGVSVHVKQESLHSRVKYFNIYVTNHEKKEKMVKLLLKHSHKNSSREEFSFISPAEKVIFHLADKMIYLVNGKNNGNGMNQCTIQSQWNVFNESYWDNKEKGVFKYQPMVKGSAVSLSEFDIELSGRETKKVNSWVISGTNKKELMDLNNSILKTY